MGQLHELLAIEGDLKGAKDKIIEETVRSFEKKEHLFTGGIKRLNMFNEDRAQEGGIVERKELATTVQTRLDYTSESYIKFLDAKLQKEATNQMAKANIEIDGITIPDLPVSFLLAMETELKTIRKIYENIPTLENGIEWIKDENLGENVFKMKYSKETNKTEKIWLHKEIAPATKEHKAQIREWTEDRPVGKYTIETWSGMISSADKSRFLKRIDDLLKAFKQARQRANTIEVIKIEIGQQLFNYINGSN